jgi:ankyrin repeat protein
MRSGLCPFSTEILCCVLTHVRVCVVQASLVLTELLLTSGANVNLCGVFSRTPLASASMTGCVDLVHALLDHGATTSSDQMSETSELTLGLGAVVDWPDTDGNTALHHACFRNHDGILSRLCLVLSLSLSVFACLSLFLSWSSVLG